MYQSNDFSCRSCLCKASIPNFQQKKSLCGDHGPHGTFSNANIFPSVATHGHYGKQTRFWWWSSLCFLLLLLFLLDSWQSLAICMRGWSELDLCFCMKEIESGWMKSCDKHWWICSTDMSPASQSTDHLTSMLGWISESCHLLQPLSTTPQRQRITTCMLETSSSSTYILIYFFVWKLKFPCSSTRWNDRGSGIGRFCPDQPLWPNGHGATNNTPKQNWWHTSYSWDSYLLTYGGPSPFP